MRGGRDGRTIGFDMHVSLSLAGSTHDASGLVRAVEASFSDFPTGFDPRQPYLGQVEATLMRRFTVRQVVVPFRTAISRLSALVPDHYVDHLQRMVAAGVRINDVYSQPAGLRSQADVMLIHDAARHGSPAFLMEVLRLGGNLDAHAITPAAGCNPESREGVLEIALSREDSFAEEIVEIIRAAQTRKLVDSILCGNLAKANP